MFQVGLHFTDNALRLIAKKAMAKNTGARGLKALLENILTEAMFEVHTTCGNIRSYSIVFLIYISLPSKTVAYESGFFLKKKVVINMNVDFCFYLQIPDKTDIDNINGVLVDEEAVGQVNGTGCGAKIICRDDGTLECQARTMCL